MPVAFLRPPFRFFYDFPSVLKNRTLISKVKQKVRIITIYSFPTKKNSKNWRLAGFMNVVWIRPIPVSLWNFLKFWHYMLIYSINFKNSLTPRHPLSTARHSRSRCNDKPFSRPLHTVVDATITTCRQHDRARRGADRGCRGVVDGFDISFLIYMTN